MKPPRSTARAIGQRFEQGCGLLTLSVMIRVMTRVMTRDCV